MTETKVIFNGALGRMGQAIIPGIRTQSDLKLVAAVDRGLQTPAALKTEAAEFAKSLSTESVPLFDSIITALDKVEVDVVVDFTTPDAVADNIENVLSAGVNLVLGTTGLNTKQLNDLTKSIKPNAHNKSKQVGKLFFAPNFTIGGVLMTEFSKQAAMYFDDVEIIEFHHPGKADAPSGTAALTAASIDNVRKTAAITSNVPGQSAELTGWTGARGALSVDEQGNNTGVYVHSVRTAGHMAAQEVIFGSSGQTLTLRHDSYDRAAYLPGILLAIRSMAKQKDPVVVGLESIL